VNNKYAAFYKDFLKNAVYTNTGFFDFQFHKVSSSIVRTDYIHVKALCGIPNRKNGISYIEVPKWLRLLLISGILVCSNCSRVSARAWIERQENTGDSPTHRSFRCLTEFNFNMVYYCFCKTLTILYLFLYFFIVSYLLQSLEPVSGIPFRTLSGVLQDGQPSIGVCYRFWHLVSEWFVNVCINDLDTYLYINF